MVRRIGIFSQFLSKITKFREKKHTQILVKLGNGRTKFRVESLSALIEFLVRIEDQFSL